MKSAEIFIRQIVVDDSPFVYSYGDGPEELESSIGRIGLLNPPLVVEEKDGIFLCVAGSRRLRIWNRISEDPVPVRLFPPTTSPRVLFMAAIDDNCFHRALNPVECGRICQKLVDVLHLDQQEIVDVFLPRMGLHPSPALLDGLMVIPELDPTTQDLLASGRMPLKNVRLLLPFQREDQTLLSHVIDAYRLGTNRQQKLLSSCWDASRRFKLTVEDFLQEVGALPLPPSEEKNLPQRTEVIFHAVHKKIWPFLSRREEQFHAVRKELIGMGDVTLHAYPFFEKKEVRLEITFHSSEDLRQTMARLLTPEQLNRLDSLFLPLDKRDKNKPK